MLVDYPDINKHIDTFEKIIGEAYPHQFSDPCSDGISFHFLDKSRNELSFILR